MLIDCPICGCSNSAQRAYCKCCATELVPTQTSICAACGEDWGGKFEGTLCPACENAKTVAARMRENELNSGIQETLGLTETVTYAGKEIETKTTAAGLLTFQNPDCKTVGHIWVSFCWNKTYEQCQRCGTVRDAQKPPFRLYSVQKVNSGIIPVEIRIKVVPMMRGIRARHA